MTMQKIAWLKGLNPKAVSPETKLALKTAQEYQQKARIYKYMLTLSRRKNGTLRRFAKKKTILEIEQMLISPGAKQILEAELRNFKKKPKGRRWTHKDKTFAASIFKRSPRTYRWLARYLTLPSESTLRIFIAKGVPYECGVSEASLRHIERLCKKLSRKDRCCSVAFDEVALEAGVYFCRVTKKLCGLEDYGSHGKTTGLADKALVFMAQGLHKKWKLPVAYYLVKGQTPTNVLARLVKDVVAALMKIGLKVLATVSDMGSNNRAAVNKLRSNCEEGEYEPAYKVDGQLIVHVWDVPHIAKNVRNNFMRSNVIFSSMHEAAKYDHLIAYKKYDENDLCRTSGLTNEVLFPKGRGKMKVTTAVKLMSSTTASGMASVILASEGRKLVECVPTILFLRDVDFFVDITNGPGANDKKKPQRCNVSKESLHHEEWRKMAAKLKDWKFVWKKGARKGKQHVPPSISGWIEDIKAFQRLWSTVEKLGFKYLNLRQLNQDCLENFFSTIRQNNGCNKNPTCQQFQSACRTAIANKLTSSGSRHKNCLDDEAFLLPETGEPEAEPTVVDIEPPSDPILVRGEDNSFPEYKIIGCKTKRQAPAYICGYFARKILRTKECKNCRLCENYLTTDEKNSDHVLTSAREFKKYRRSNNNKREEFREALAMYSNDDGSKALKYASPQLVKTFLNIQGQFVHGINKQIHLDPYKWTEEICNQTIQSEELCPIHDLKKQLVTTIATFLMKTHCLRINQLIRDKRRQKAFINRRRHQEKQQKKGKRNWSVNVSVVSDNVTAEEYMDSSDSDDDMIDDPESIDNLQDQSNSPNPSVQESNNSVVSLDQMNISEHNRVIMDIPHQIIPENNGLIVLDTLQQISIPEDNNTFVLTEEFSLLDELELNTPEENIFLGAPVTVAGPSTIPANPPNDPPPSAPDPKTNERLSYEFVENLVKMGQVMNLKVPEMKQFLKGKYKNLSTLKKAELAQLIIKHINPG
ncbi:uncharacterized protein LOC117648507 [Thrips palmi]|uniref:Uncharacterized protein LOC117648507 n=1 Tax=Thrips palmi TaxID=161013 RepID=A0A6P8ZR33_THRPL|nr:uncharacterized protein LOC117648507 [Thrips palmi]